MTFNSLADLPACLESVYAQTHGNIEVVIFDNDSEDDTCTWLRASGLKLRIIPNDQNIGFAQAHNRILSLCYLSDGAFYLALNPDVILDTDYVNRLVSLIREKRAGWATGKLLLRDGDPQQPPLIYSVGHALRHDGYAFNIAHRLPDQGQVDEVREVFGAPGAAALFSQAMIEALTTDGELFEGEMFMYVEDSDLDWRARRAGWCCWYTPQAVAYHLGSHANGRLRDMAVGNRYLSVIKNAFLIDLIFYNLPSMLTHLAARLVITPRRGWWLIVYVCRRAPIMWRKRRKPVVPRSALTNWFRWSKSQPTRQPTSALDRLRSFLKVGMMRSP